MFSVDAISDTWAPSKLRYINKRNCVIRTKSRVMLLDMNLAFCYSEEKVA